MANISSASGTITIRGTKEQILAYGYLMEKYSQEWHYETYINDSFELDNIVSEGDSYSLTVYFTGSGRWAYNTNVEYMFQWLLSSINALESSDQEGYKVGHEKLNLLVTQKSDQIEGAFHLEFEYIDEESGCDLLCESTERVVPYLEDLSKGVTADNLKTTFETLGCTSYEYSAKNLIALGLYERGEVFDFSVESVQELLAVVDGENDESKVKILKEIIFYIESLHGELIKISELKAIFDEKNRKRNAEKLSEHLMENGNDIRYSYSEMLYDGEDFPEALMSLIEEDRRA